MESLDYKVRAELNVYPQYLELLAQEGKAVQVSFDGVKYLQESGYTLLNIDTPVKPGYVFSHWENKKQVSSYLRQILLM